MIHGGEIVRVQPGSIAEELGLEPGDILRSVNKRPLRDVIDYRFYSATDAVELLVERGEDHFYCEVEKEPGSRPSSSAMLPGCTRTISPPWIM